MKKISNIIILAGGDGDRFWPLKEKMLTQFVGKPFIQHLIDSLNIYAEKIYVVVNEANRAHMEEVVGPGIETIVQTNLHGMGGAIISCKNKVKGDTLVIGNDIFDFSIMPQIIDKLHSSQADLVFLAKKVTSYFPGGYLKLENGRVTEIVEKPEPSKTPSDLVYLVVNYFKDIVSFISMLEKTNTDSDDLYEKGMSCLIKTAKVEYIPYSGYWKALKYSWHVLSIMRYFLGSMKDAAIDKTAVISKSALINGMVHIGKNVKIGDFVKIGGPCYIGDNTIIADYALVRESHIGPNCLIGSSSEVARSYLGEGAMLHRNYVGDSVFAPHVLMGAGSVTANFRFDKETVSSYIKGKRINTQANKLGAVVGDDAKIGVNSTLYPGVKIAAGSMIFPGEIVRRDREEKLSQT